MSKLHIDLQDGFSGDDVAIRLDGREVYRKSGVRTDLRISRADGVDVDAPEDHAEIEVTARGAKAVTALDPKQTPYVAVNLQADGRPAIRVASDPFPYL